MAVVDVLRFEGKLDRIGYVATPVVDVVVVATCLGIVDLAARASLGTGAADVVVGLACTVALAQLMACVVSVQWRRLHDIGLAGYHALWIDALLGALPSVSKPAYAVAAVAFNVFFLAMPGHGDGARFAFPSPFRRRP